MSVFANFDAFMIVEGYVRASKKSRFGRIDEKGGEKLADGRWIESIRMEEMSVPEGLRRADYIFHKKSDPERIIDVGGRELPDFRRFRMKRLITVLLCGMMMLSCAACGTESEETMIVGGYSAPESPVITDEIREVVDKATADVEGVEYTPVAYLEKQVVAGMNHRVLCTRMTAGETEEQYVILKIYADLQGNAEIMSETVVEDLSPYEEILKEVNK